MARCSGFSSARRWLTQRFVCRIARRLALLPARGVTHRLRLSMTLLTFHPRSIARGIAPSSDRQPLSQRFGRRIARRMSQQIALSSACQRLSRQMAGGIAQRMAVDGSGLLILALVNGLHDGFRTVFLRGWRGLLILSLVNSFHDGLRAVFLSGWQRIAHSCTRQRLSRRFSRRISQRMAADCSFFLLSTAFMTVCAPYCSADGSALLILPLVKGFHDRLRAILLTGWQRIAPSSTRQQLFRRFTHDNAQRMTADYSYFRSSKPFTTDCAAFCSAAGSAFLILQFVKGFHDGLRAVLLSALQRIAHTSARQRLSQRFAHHIAQRMAADCSLLRSSTGVTMICALYCSANGSADGITVQ